MFRLTDQAIRANKVRFLLTGVAVLLGVAFMAGTLVLTDTIKRVLRRHLRHRHSWHRRRRPLVPAFGERRPGRRDREARSRASVARRSSAGSDGVRAAEPQQRGIADRRRPRRPAARRKPQPLRADRARLAADAPQLNPMELVAGHAPRAPDEIVDRPRVGTGRSTSPSASGSTWSAPVGSRGYRISGIATYGGADGAAGAQVVAFTPDTAAQVLGTPGRYDGDPGRRRARASTRSELVDRASAPLCTSPDHRGHHRRHGDAEAAKTAVRRWRSSTSS